MDDNVVSFTSKPVDGSASPDSQSLQRGHANETSGNNESHIRTVGGGSRGRDTGPMDRLDRYLSSRPIISFGLALQASWEAVALSFQSPLLNGGPSSLVYGCILSSFGSSAMAATLGEMASMKPCVGAECLPTFMPVTAANMNWAGPILAAAIVITLSTGFMSGSKNLRLPQDEVEK